MEETEQIEGDGSQQEQRGLSESRNWTRTNIRPLLLQYNDPEEEEEESEFNVEEEVRRRNEQARVQMLKLEKKLLNIRLFLNKVHIYVVDEKCLNFKYSGVHNPYDGFTPRAFISQSIDSNSLGLMVSTPNGPLHENEFTWDVPKEENEQSIFNTDEILYLGNVMVGEHKITKKKIYVERIIRNQRFSAIRFKLMEGEEHFHGRCHLGLRERSSPTYYFETKILQTSERALASCTSVGLCPVGYEDVMGLIGWYDDSIGYHSDNGGIYDHSCTIGEKDDLENETFEQGDVIGCGWKSDGTVFFTKNGKLQPRKGFRDRKFFSEEENDMLFAGIFFQNNDDNRPMVFEINRGEDTVTKPFAFIEMNSNSVRSFKRNMGQILANKNRFSDLVILTIS